jgi:hypothetical protein
MSPDIVNCPLGNKIALPHLWLGITDLSEYDTDFFLKKMGRQISWEIR